MFHWRKEMERLDVPASRVLRLQRSLSDVQVALPGLPSQEASAFVCAYAAGRGVQIVVGLALRASGRMAFYQHDGGSADEAGRLLQEGVRFAESLGFMLADTDFQLLTPQQKTSLWETLPLRTGIVETAFAVAVEPEREEPLPSEVTVSAAPAATEEVPENGAVLSLEEEAEELLALEVPPAEPSAIPVEEEVIEEEVIEEEVIEEEVIEEEVVEEEVVEEEVVEDASGPSAAAAPACPPSANEIARRRGEFLQMLGRFLASL